MAGQDGDSIYIGGAVFVGTQTAHRAYDTGDHFWRRLPLVGSCENFLHLDRVKSAPPIADKTSAIRLSDSSVLASEMQSKRNMELLGRACAALGISLVLTLLLLVLYQDDGQQGQSATMTQVTATIEAR
jgi:hypothetical protein